MKAGVKSIEVELDLEDEDFTDEQRAELQRWVREWAADWTRNLGSVLRLAIREHLQPPCFTVCDQIEGTSNT